MQIPLTKRQEEILLGSILGDGGIYPSTSNETSCCYYTKQSKTRKGYLFWLYEELKSICCSSPKQRKDNGQWYLRSRYLKNFYSLRQKFYPHGVKIVPSDIETMLTSPLALAIWYMDDGTLDYRPGYHCSFLISTHSFSDYGVKKLVEVLGKNFGIKASMYKDIIRGISYPRIYIGAEGRNRFIKSISPYILKCFQYKLPQYRQPLRDFSRIKLER